MGVVDEARLAAEGEVNSYLARRYRAPIDLTTHADLADLLASVTLDLVEYRLRVRRPPVGDDARRRYTEALEAMCDDNDVPAHAWVRAALEATDE